MLSLGIHNTLYVIISITIVIGTRLAHGWSTKASFVPCKNPINENDLQLKKAIAVVSK